MSINKETILSPPVIFIIYVTIACLFILVFRLIFPGETAPLPIFSHDWRVIQGLLDIFALFPALALSALVIPFGIASSEENSYTGFSKHFFQRLIAPLMTAIGAATLYALLFFLILPLTQNYGENLRFKGNVYHLAKERAQTHAQNGKWLEVSQFIGICDSIWKDSPEIANLRNDLEIHLQELLFEQYEQKESSKNLNSASVSALPGQGKPMNAADAIAMSERALNEERPFDAHWLATLGERIAKAGSVESAKATQLAARAWNQIESQQPTSREARVYSIYLLKLSGYEAMVSGDWIRAYYIFKELLELTPYDPDAVNFFAASEKGTKEVAFFVDEMEVSLGEMFTGTILSLPINQNRGRDRYVLRLSSLSSAPDYAYGTGIEYMVFDANAQPRLYLQAPYAKFLPITLNDQPQTLVLMRALDRNDRSKRWEPEWSAENNTVYQPETAQITLNISYETFLMLSEIRQEPSNLHIETLFTASKIAGEAGYIPEVFHAEILNRLGACLFFLPMAVITIIIGWRLRAKSHPRYLFVLSLPVLPIVFNGIVHLYRNVLNVIGVFLILNLGFSTALTVFIVSIALAFFFSLILLAAQHD